MSSEITTAFVKQFGSTVFHLSQQQGSRLRMAVRNETQKGESQFFDRIGSVTAEKKTSRHADTPISDTPHSRRMVTLQTYHHADLVDSDDKVRMLIDPASDYVKAFMWALGRGMDDEIIDNALGTAYSGKNGSTTVSWPNTQKIAATDGSTAGTNLNVTALRRAKKVLDAADVDPSIPRFFALTSSQLFALLGETEVTSSDYNTVKALVQGDIDTFLGFKFLMTERLDTQSGALSFDYAAGTVGSGSGDANGYRRCIAWAKDGLLLSVGEEPFSRISERDDKSYAQQAYVEMSVGSTRMEEEKVVEVLCNEA